MLNLELLFEGFETALMPCSLTLLVPCLGLALVARPAAIPAIFSFIMGAGFLAWVRFGGYGGGFGQGAAAIAILTAAILLLVPFTVRWDVLAVLAGFIAGGAAAELWVPCVGEAFGTLIGDLDNKGLVGLIQTEIYVAAALSPMLILGAIHFVLPDALLERAEPIWAVPGAVILGVLAFATALGLHSQLIGFLFEWSAG